MLITMDKKEFENVRCTIQNIYVNLVISYTTLNSVGSKKQMQDLDELLTYLELLDYLIGDWEFIDNLNINDADLFRIHNRALELSVKIKRNVL